MKKKLFYMAVILISLAIIAGSTFALFTTEQRTRNVITTGHIEVFVVEEQAGGAPYPIEAIPIMPGAKVSKIAMAEASEDCAPAWVRMKIDTVITDADGNIMPHTQEQLDKLVTIKTDRENWMEQNSWYYYCQPIEKGGRTTALFEDVQFSGPHMGNEYQGATIEVIVTAQGVQKDNNGDDVLEAIGWPQDKPEAIPDTPEP